MKKEIEQNQIPTHVLIREADLTLETVILLVLGVFMLLFGLLQIKIHSGDLPYNHDGTYGLLLVIVSLQIITMGKTPFGTFRRSWILVLIGIGTAVLGTIACFIPDILSDFIHNLIGIILVTGGTALLLQLIFHKEKARQWIRIPSILQHLTFACGLVYLLEIIIGVVTLFPDSTMYPLNAVLYSLFGISFFYLAWCIQKVASIYPQKESQDSTITSSSTIAGGKKYHFLVQDASIPTNITIFLLLGVVFIQFTILLVPISLGVFPFSKSSQVGLLMVIMAIQVLALGKTPIGEYKRSWLLIMAGLFIASVGIYSCIIPGLLTDEMLILLGSWNLITGSVNLFKLTFPILKNIYRPPAKPVSVSPLIKKLHRIAALLHLATMVFGINLLFVGIIPDMVIIVTLFCLGVLFLALAYFQAKIPPSN